VEEYYAPYPAIGSRPEGGAIWKNLGKWWEKWEW